MALLNYEFDRQLELERADAYAEGFLRGYKKGFEKKCVNKWFLTCMKRDIRSI